MYYVCILIFPVVWVGISLRQQRYPAVWAFPGWIYLICESALFEKALRKCTAATSTRNLLMLGWMNTVVGTLSAGLGIFSVLIVPPPCHFAEQCFILLCEVALAARNAEKRFSTDREKGVELQNETRQGVHNQNNSRRTDEASDDA